MSIELIVVLIYCAIMVVIGLTFSKRAGSSNEEYLAAGRSIPWWLNGIAIVAAYFSSSAILGGTSIGYAWGFPFTLMLGFPTAFGFFIAAFMIAGPLRRSKAISVADYFDKRFQSKLLNLLIPIVICVLFTLYLVPMLKSGGMLLESITTIPYSFSVLIIGIVFTAYVLFGGMWGVTITDFFQGLMLWLLMVSLGLTAIAHFNGLGSLLDAMYASRPEFGEILVNPVSVIGNFVCFGVGLAAMPTLMMRLFSSGSIRHARKSVVFALVLVIIFSLAQVMVVSASAALIPQGTLGDSDYLFFEIMKMLVPGSILRGIFLACMLAAIMSTTDAMMLASGTAVGYDIYGKYLSPKSSVEKQIKVTRFAMIGVAAIAMVLAFNPPGLIMIITGSIFGCLASCFFPALVYGIWWKKASRFGAELSMSCSLAIYAILYFFFNMPTYSEAIVTLPISIALMIVGSYLKPDKKAVDNEDLQTVAN